MSDTTAPATPETAAAAIAAAVAATTTAPTMDAPAATSETPDIQTPAAIEAPKTVTLTLTPEQVATIQAQAAEGKTPTFEVPVDAPVAEIPVAPAMPTVVAAGAIATPEGAAAGALASGMNSTTDVNVGSIQKPSVVDVAPPAVAEALAPQSQIAVR